MADRQPEATGAKAGSGRRRAAKFAPAGCIRSCCFGAEAPDSDLRQAAAAEEPSSSAVEKAVSYGVPLTAAFACFVLLIISWARGADAAVLLFGVIIFFILFGELFYSRLLANYVFQLSNDEVTPANEQRNEGHPDFEATPSYILWGHHWTSITGAAPIVGPALACVYGWLPGMCWVVFGCVFSGAVHDFGALVVSARNGGRSIADLAGWLVSPRARLFFLLLINFCCILVVSKFMELIAKLFISFPESVLPVNAEIPLAVGLGLLNHFVFKKVGGWKAKALVTVCSITIVVVLYGLVFAAVKIEDDGGVWEGRTKDADGNWVGGKNVDPVFGWAIGDAYNHREICRDSVNYKRDADGNPAEGEWSCGFGAMQFWTIALCLYSMAAATLPVWVLLQPRDFINSHQLKVVMLGLVLCLFGKGNKIDAPAVRTDLSDTFLEKSPIFPMMFTTIACGATSGFHALVSSGVTSKQLNKMRDARPIGYSAMMGESTLSVLVIVVVSSAGTWKTLHANGSNWAGFLAAGGVLLEELGIDPRPARSIMNVLIVSFAATTLDSGMRIQRILIGELGKVIESVSPSGCASVVGKLFRNIFFQVVVAALPSIYIANSRSIGAVWNLFGATNQLTACVSLIVVAVYVLRHRRWKIQYILPFIVPIMWLLVMISWALIRVIIDYIDTCDNVLVDGCDWHSTTPIYPTIIIAFLIAAMVLAIYIEVAYLLVSFMLSGKNKDDKEVDETGKILGDHGLAETSNQMNVPCC